MSAEILGRAQLVKNFSDFHDKVVDAIVAQTEIIQARVANFAKSNHHYTDRTGNLTNSIQPGEIFVKNNVVEAEVAARMTYASYVEGGTSKMRAFPYLHPAIVAHAGEFRSRIQMAIRNTRI